MSLLDYGNEDVIVYPEEFITDSDGNVITRPVDTGVPARVLIQAMPQSGTSARVEQDLQGFETEQLYRMRFTRGNDIVLGPRSYIEWNGERWSINGFPIRYNSGSRTAHTDYVIKRS